MRSRKALLALMLIAALLPGLAFATQVDVREYGVSVTFPSSLDVFTRDMGENDPVLGLYGKTADQVARELRDAGLYALAQDIAGAFTLGLSLSPTSEPDLASLPREGLEQAAKALGGSRFEVFSGRGATFLLVWEDSGQVFSCFSQAGGLRFLLRLVSGKGISQGMVSLVKDIAQRADVPAGQ